MNCRNKEKSIERFNTVVAIEIVRGIQMMVRHCLQYSELKYGSVLRNLCFEDLSLVNFFSFIAAKSCTVNHIFLFFLFLMTYILKTTAN